MARLLAGIPVQVALFAALVMGPAWGFTGRLDWTRGWLVVAVLAAVSAGGALWVWSIDPVLARERTSLQPAKSGSDALATLLIGLTVIGWFVAAAWDVHRLQLLPAPPTASFLAGAVVFLAGCAVFLWTLRENAFAVTVVKVQDQQRVIDTGPYAFVRHPMYAGSIIFFAGLGLMLGSAAAALLAIPLFAVAFAPRMMVEETVLRRELPGYGDYQARVRTRLIPGLL